MQQARAALVRELRKRKSDVLLSDLRAVDGVNGPDDYIAGCGDAAPLIDPAGEDSGGFYLRGPSSCGETTALKLAASVWDEPKADCRLWRATSNGLEGLAALHNDGLLILDELSQIDPKEAGENACLLANGRGKARAARQSASWRLIFLSAGRNRSLR